MRVCASSRGSFRMRERRVVCGIGGAERERTKAGGVIYSDPHSLVHTIPMVQSATVYYCCARLPVRGAHYVVCFRSSTRCNLPTINTILMIWSDEKDTYCMSYNLLGRNKHRSKRGRYYTAAAAVPIYLARYLIMCTTGTS